MFINNTVYLLIDLELGRYICATCENWDKHKLKDKFLAGNKENKEYKDMEESLGNQYMFYVIYN